MIFYDYYADVPEHTLREFVNQQELCRFITCADGQPHIGSSLPVPGRNHRDPPASIR